MKRPWSLLALAAVIPLQALAQVAVGPAGIGTTEIVSQNDFRFLRKARKTSRIVTIDNYGSDAIGPLTTILAASIPRFFADNDQFDSYFVLGGPDRERETELVGGGIGYRIATFGDTSTLYFRGDWGRVTPGKALNRVLEVEGTYLNLAAGLRRTWAMTKASSIDGWLGIAARHARGQILGSTALDEDLRILKAGLVYRSGARSGFRRAASLWLSKGLSGLGASRDDSQLSSIPGATTDFLVTSMSAAIRVPLPRRFSWRSLVVGQWTGDALPLSQKCGYGTNAVSRGFDTSFVLGDRCIGMRHELDFDAFSPDGGLVQFYAGLDFGIVETLANPFARASTTSWKSGSIGVRTIFKDFAAEATVTRILKRPVSLIASGAGRQQATRFWIRAAARF